jgi:hypothetical protein
VEWGGGGGSESATVLWLFFFVFCFGLFVNFFLFVSFVFGSLKAGMQYN